MRARRERVGAENPVMSCDLDILWDEAAEPVTSERPNGRRPGTWGSAARRRVLVQRSVRSVPVVVLCELA
jgi:hypothetical protein